jgi:hypothetical protein
MNQDCEAAFAADPKSYLESDGYLQPRQLPAGEWAGVMRFAFTWGLCLGLDAHGYRTRFCYALKHEALNALAVWDGKGHPLGRWIKEMPSGALNPLAAEAAE